MEKNDLKEKIKWSIAEKVGLYEADRLAELAADLHEELECRKVIFRFTKTDGSTREAFGTLCEDFLPKRNDDDTTSKQERKPNYSVMCYWDIEKSAWRSFKIENLLNYE